MASGSSEEANSAAAMIFCIGYLFSSWPIS